MAAFIDNNGDDLWEFDALCVILLTNQMVVHKDSRVISRIVIRRIKQILIKCQNLSPE